ncbi:hypothetical protein JJQ72_11555 [Paenibacillus sp. F411]|uniref:hypothetical protein n=1 Tax=Paenibacillus sp. F411 TaxID=2820239 RepID=UPI001AAEFE1B|nr:hypothetical protein [Paenibacillus sp. F411]MBO2944605.1 hypothetical protein [Paenibacillus sp. F411]
MRREIGLLLLVSAVVLSGCNSHDNGSIKQGANESQSSPVKTGTERGTKTEGPEMKTWSSENDEVKVSVVKVSKYNTPEVVSVEVDGVKKEFNWRVAEDPRIFYIDVTGDTKPEAVIITNLGRGSDSSIDELHVLNSSDLSEIKVPNYEEVSANIETNVTKAKDGRLTITIEAQGKEYEFNDTVVYPGLDVQDKVLFGGTVTYGLEKQTLFSYLGGSIGTSPIYVTEILVTYKFDSSKNEFVVDHISPKSVSEK